MNCSTNIDENSIIRALNINSHPRRAPSITEVHWVRPPPGWIKVINTDRSAQGAPGSSSYGGIFRTYRGFVEGYFSQALNIGNAYKVQIMAFVFATEKVADFDWKNLWIEYDSTYIINAFKCSENSISLKIHNRWLNALVLFKKLNVKVSHILREGNLVADKLDN